jgi:hypothetical protein
LDYALRMSVRTVAFGQQPAIAAGEHALESDNPFALAVLWRALAGHAVPPPRARKRRRTSWSCATPLPGRNIAQLVKSITTRAGVTPVNVFTSVFGGFSARLNASQLRASSRSIGGERRA